MSIWPTDDPTGTHPSEAGGMGVDDGCPWDDDEDPRGDHDRVPRDHDGPGDDIDRADLDAATRADVWVDEQSGTDYDGPDWPF